MERDTQSRAAEAEQEPQTAGCEPHPRRGLYLCFSLLTTILVFGYIFSDIDLDEVVAVIREAYLPSIALFVVLSLLMSIFRTWRYRLLLDISGWRPSSYSLFLVVLVRNFFSDLLPARLGTLVYVFIITTRLGIPFGPAASSFAVSFIFDLIALAPIILLASVGALLGTAIHWFPLALGGIILGLLAGAVLLMLPKVMGIIGDLGAKRFAIGSQWVQTVAETRRELLRTQNAGCYPKLLALSLLVRLCKYTSLYFLLHALLAPRGFTLAELPPAKVFLGICSSELMASLPISGIAGFGAYEGAWAVVFELLGFESTLAKLTAVAHHLLSQIYGYGLGLLALMLLLAVVPALPRRKYTPN